MKKHLLSTSAIALGAVAMAAPAAAQEWDVSFSGFMSQHVGYADVSGASVSTEDRDGVFMHSNTEIHFTPSVTLDNGLTFGVTVELEGENQGSAASRIDETFMTISSDTLGQIIVGSENSAGYKAMVGAPGVVSMALNSPSISSYIPFSSVGAGSNGYAFRQASLSTFTEVGGNNDVQRLTYFTPSFNGLTVGVSYAPNGDINAENGASFDRSAADLKDIFDIGLNYSQSFGTTDVTLSARYGTSDTTTTGRSDPETWGIGAQFGFGAFTVGASYAENDSGYGVGTASQIGDSEGWDLGVTYDAPGPWAFEATTFQGKADYWDAGSTKQRDEYQAYRIGASRDLGPGVDWDIYVAHVDADRKTDAAEDVNGTVIGTGINLSF